MNDGVKRLCGVMWNHNGNCSLLSPELLIYIADHNFKACLHFREHIKYNRPGYLSRLLLLWFSDVPFAHNIVLTTQLCEVNLDVGAKNCVVSHSVILSVISSNVDRFTKLVHFQRLSCKLVIKRCNGR